jgi:hypothetical protein
MSFHSPIDVQKAGGGNARSRRIRCDLPSELPVSTEEVDLLLAWLGDVVSDLLGPADGASDISHERKD